jgi:hypothetical protein
MKKVAHLSDHDLVSYLSNEMGPWRRGLARRHVEGCWICAGRMKETEELFLQLAREVRRWQETDAEDIRHAKARFRKRILATTEQPEPLTAPRRRRRWKFAAVCGAMAAALLIAVGIASRAEDPLYRARNAEARLAKEGTLRQEFELAVTPAQGKPSRSRIELVSERASGRFVVTWRNGDGSLIYGLWRPSATRVLAYQAAEQTGVRPVRSPLQNRGGRATFPRGAGIEKAVGDWLEFRELRPIRLTRDGFLTSELGDLGKPTEVAKTDGQVMLTWDEAAPFESARLCLQVDAGTFLPISQTLLAESSPVQLKIKLLSQGPLDAAALEPQIFEPSPLLIMARAVPSKLLALPLWRLN